MKGCERQSAGKPNIKPAGHDSCHPSSQVTLTWWFGLVVWKSGKSEFYAIYTTKYELLFAFCFVILNTYLF